MRICCPCLFGLERSLADEFMRLTYPTEQLKVSDGLAALELSETLSADPLQVAYELGRCNLNLASAERCQLELFSFHATDFNSYYEAIFNFPWEHYIQVGMAIRVDGFSRNSHLFGVPALQRLMKQAVVKRLLLSEGRSAGDRLPEDEAAGQIDLRFALTGDEVSVRVDTSGPSLHKRGYRREGGNAPLKETLAAGMLDIMRWRADGSEALVDLFCGSGTIVIEAARKFAHVAPGLGRHFAMERWPYLPAAGLARARAEAESRYMARREELETMRLSGGSAIFLASDYSPEAVALARKNAKLAGVADLMQFSCQDARVVNLAELRADLGAQRMLLLSNPPYGERLSDPLEVENLERELGEAWLCGDGSLPEGLRWGVISSDEQFEAHLGYKADKRRKLYNGMIKCQLYQFFRGGARARFEPVGRTRRSNTGYFNKKEVDR